MRDPKAIFLDALDLPPGQRADFIDTACAGDEELRQRVLSYLQAHSQAKGFLDRPMDVRPTWVAGNDEPAAGDEAQSDHRPGDVIDADGRYELVRQLGEGGFGVVYLARQREPVQRLVAVKIIKRGMDSRQIISRFNAERQTLAMMDHPNIARVLDAGETARGNRPYFVMEYVEGGHTIIQFAHEHQLSVQERLRLMEKVCLAVQHAHTKGVIHRDLKPGNILVTIVDGRPAPKIIDFGVAKATEPSGRAAPHVTAAMQIIGTPQYMSPEQALTGEAADGQGVDTRSDVYSLGTVLYELMTGAPPFDAASLRRAGLEEICRIIREETPPRPSTRVTTVARSQSSADTIAGAPVTRLRRQLDGEIDWIVMKALEKEPARRFQSAAEMAADIRRHLSGDAVLAGPPSRLYQIRKFARRHRMLIAAAMVVVVSLAATAIVGTVMASRARAAELLARDQKLRAELELNKAIAFAAFTERILTGIDPAVARGRDTSVLSEILATAAADVGTVLQNQPSVEAAVRAMIGTAYLQIGKITEGAAELERAYEMARSRPDFDQADLLKMAVTLGSAYSESNAWDKAERILKDTVATYDTLGKGDARHALDARTNLATVYLDLGRNADARAEFQKVLDARTRTLGPKHPRTLLEMNNVATAARRMGDSATARQLWERSLTLHRETVGEDHPQTMVLMNNLATLYEDLDMLVEAERLYRDSLAAKRRVFPAGHPSLIRSIANVGGFLERNGKVDEGAPLIHEAARMAADSLGPDHEQTLHINLRLVQLLRREQKWEEACALIQRTQEAFARKLGNAHQDSVRALSIRVAALADAGRFDEGVRVLAEHEPAPLPVEDTELACSLHVSAGRALLGAGRRDEALKRLESAKALASAHPVSPAVAQRITDLEQNLAR